MVREFIMYLVAACIAFAVADFLVIMLTGKTKIYRNAVRNAMMEGGRKFYKVSEKQYLEDLDGMRNELAEIRDASKKALESIYSDIKLPKRATSGSAGYDFFAPFSFMLAPGESIKIPTGIKVKIWPKCWLLAIVPRSSLGFKYRLQIDNTFAVIDADYYGNLSNEGHIFIKLTNDSKTGKELLVKKGEAFAQGVFLMYGLTYDDHTNQERTGGIGSTSK